MYKLLGFGARECWAKYQQLVALFMEVPTESDGSRRVHSDALGVPGFDQAVCSALLHNVRGALAAHPEHELHGWTVNYNLRECYFIARPPVRG